MRCSRRCGAERCSTASSRCLASNERYGFDLVRGLADVDGMVTSEGTIYPLLSRLRRDGLVESTWRESPTGPPRRYYRATSAGKAALEDFRREWHRFRDAVDIVVGGKDER
jgi:PadR family transcriptional regulator PadR